MKTKLQELLDELKGLKRYYIEVDSDCDFELVEQGRQDLIRDPELVIKDFDLKELIAKYTETTPTYKPGDKVRVIKCLYEHCFNDGEIITLLKYRETHNDWKCSVEGMIQHLTEEEFEPIN